MLTQTGHVYCGSQRQRLEATHKGETISCMVIEEFEDCHLLLTFPHDAQVFPDDGMVAPQDGQFE